MISKRKTWLYCLSPDEGKSFYYVENDVVKVMPFSGFVSASKSFFLPHNPARWKELEIDWGTSEELLMNRAYALQLEFVYEGAQILRSRQYFGAGSEENMWLIIAKWNRDTDEYGLEVKIQLDLSSTTDTATGSVAINSIEGGISRYLSANRSTVYEISCDESNPAAKLLLFDGMNLSETLNYSILEVQVDGDFYTVPFTFLNNEGDHEDVLFGSPIIEQTSDDNDYYKTSNNYLIKNISDSVPLLLHFKIPLDINEIDSDGIDGIWHLRKIISTDAAVISKDDISTQATPYGRFLTTLEFDVTLAPGEKLFIDQWIFFSSPGTSGGLVTYNKSKFKISFTSRKSESQSFVLSLYDYYKQIVSKLTEGKYTGESAYLSGRTDLVVTCGDALRNTDRNVVKNYVIASSFDDFKQSCPGSIASGSRVGLQIRGNVLYLELISDLYSNSNPIYDLGEVSDLKTIFNGELLCNEIQAGYPDQDYETNGGKYEFNSEQVWKNAIISRSKTLNLRATWRADGRGIEDIRSRFTSLDTTDNAGDKTPFLLSVAVSGNAQSTTIATATSKDYTGQQWVVFDTLTQSSNSYFITDANRYIYTFTGNYQQANISFFITINAGGHNVQVLLFKNGQSIGVYTGDNTTGTSPISFIISGDVLSLNDNFEVRVTPFDVGFDDYTVLSATIYFDYLVRPLILNRPSYSTITGVLDNTVYNVPLRPKNQLYAAGIELSAMLAQIPTTKITLTSSKKNVLLSTTLAGTTETENEPISYNELAPPLWYAYNFTFTTQVPYTFAQLFLMSTAGYFSFLYNGIQFFALPIGQMKSTPVGNNAQEWTLRVSSKNLFTDLYAVSYNENVSLSFNNNLITKNIYCPLKLNDYGVELAAKYRHKDTYDDFTHLQYESWIYSGVHNAYKQPWQLSDTIVIPIKTAGNVGIVSVLIYDARGELYDTVLFTVQSTVYVKLPEVLQIATIPLSAFDEGYYLFVINFGGTNKWMSDWCDIRTQHIDAYGKPNTFLFNYGHSQNELNVPWRAYPSLQLRVQAEFEQWESESEFVGYEDDEADFYVESGLPLQKRNLYLPLIPDWMALKLNAILLKDGVYIEGDYKDEIRHYTRRESAQMETTKYPGNPYIRADIEVIPARNPINQTQEDIPVDDQSGWHATIDAQVYGEDVGSTEILIENE